MVTRGVTRPLLAVQSAWRAAGGWAARQLITGNRRVALVLAVVTVFISVAAVHVSQSWFSPGLLILPVLAGGLLLWPRAPAVAPPRSALPAGAGGRPAGGPPRHCLQGRAARRRRGEEGAKEQGG